MQRLSERAIAILERMDPNRSYDATELRALVPELSIDAVRDVMHELWVQRQVERLGFAGWRRDRSSWRPDSGVRRSHGNGGEVLPPAQTKAVKPEDLFDHDSFADFFK